MAKLKKMALPGGQVSSFPPHTLSVCMIVKNEEHHLPNCLKGAAAVADEIVVVDTGSTDRTPDIAREAGAKVIRSDWRDDFSYSRNISLDNAASAWILWLDADDRLPEASCEGILKIKREAKNLTAAFGFRVKNARMGGRIGEEFLQIRMFPNDRRIRFVKRVHEQVTYALDRHGYTVHHVPEILIEHHGYDLDLDGARKKAYRNRRILEADMKNWPDDPHYLSAYGDTFFMAEEWEPGIEVYKKVFALPNCRKKQADIYTYMPVTIALGYKHLGQYPTALEWVERGLSAAPEKLELLFLGGETAYESGDMETALRYYRRASRAPEAPATTPLDHAALTAKSRYLEAEILRKKGDLAQARELLTGLLTSGLLYDVHASLAEIAAAQGDLAAALRHYSDSILLFPGADVRAYRGLAEISERAGRPDDAAAFCEKGISFFPGDLPLLERLKALARGRNDMGRYLEVSRRILEFGQVRTEPEKGSGGNT